MAYIRKRGSTWSYTADIGIDPVTGKRKQKTQGGFSSKREASAAAKIVEYQYSQGIYVHEKNITFKDFANDWLRLYAATGKIKESSVDARRTCMNRIFKHISNIPIKNVTRKMYQDMLFTLHDSNFSKETIISTHATAKLIFNKAVELEVIAKNPTQYSIVPVKRATVEELENKEELPDYFEKEELAHFLRTVQKFGTLQEYAQFYLLAYTGMRVGELCVLKWSDIDFDTGTISITKTLYNNKNNTINFKLLPPKTSSSVRDIEAGDSVLKILEKLRLNQKEFRMKRRDVYTDHNFVFINRRRFPGYPEMQKSHAARMKKFLKLAEQNENLTPHALRHTHVSLLAELKVPIEAIMERLGHQDDKVTKIIYLHVTKSVKKETASKFAELMDGL